MDQNKIIEKIEETLDIDAGTLTPETELSTLDEWDSLAKLSLIVLAADEFKKELTGEQVRSFQTVADILAVLG